MLETGSRLEKISGETNLVGRRWGFEETASEV